MDWDYEPPEWNLSDDELRPLSDEEQTALKDEACFQTAEDVVAGVAAHSWAQNHLAWLGDTHGLDWWIAQVHKLHNPDDLWF